MASWTDKMSSGSTNPAMQPLVDQPVTREQLQYNAGIMYAKAGACFEGLYKGMVTEPQQGRGA